jgi:DNA-binding response OmpR family regulator
MSRSYPGRIDLLVTDVMMPGLTGRELADRVRADRPGLPVLFMTGYPDLTAAGVGALGDREALVRKPFRPGELLTRVRGLLDDP